MEYAKGILIDDSPLTAELEVIARAAIRDALVDYDLSGISNKLFVVHRNSSPRHIFELWIAGEENFNEILIASATVDEITKQVQAKINGLSRIPDSL
jgi:hypothetical protein